jgi:hypothetical protein
MSRNSLGLNVPFGLQPNFSFSYISFRVSDWVDFSEFLRLECTVLVTAVSQRFPNFIDYLRVLRPNPPFMIRQTGITIPGNGGVWTLQLWISRTILSVKMDRENSITLLLPKWGSNPIPSDLQSEPPADCATASGSAFLSESNRWWGKICFCLCEFPLSPIVCNCLALSWS